MQGAYACEPLRTGHKHRANDIGTKGNRIRVWRRRASMLISSPFVVLWFYGRIWHTTLHSTVIDMNNLCFESLANWYACEFRVNAARINIKQINKFCPEWLSADKPHPWAQRNLAYGKKASKKVNKTILKKMPWKQQQSKYSTRFIFKWNRNKNHISRPNSRTNLTNYCDTFRGD